ncbi:sugar phosphate isomerase/epimerase family protein [Verrucomicrobiota bacterium sgz303538]
MNSPLSRRHFLHTSATALAALSFGPAVRAFAEDKEPLFKISLAEWSLHRALFDKKLTNLDFPRVAKNEFGINAVEYVNQFWMDKAKDAAYLSELKKITEGEGVKNVLIMCDREGDLGDPDEGKRRQAVENHYKWVEAAKTLGCHSIRVNARSSGSYEEQMGRAADGLRKLSEFAAQHGQNVIVENHGGLSSNGAWLVATIKKVGLPNCGTLPDFGNFTIDKKTGENYDRYKGVEEMMPFAKGVSAKTHDFDAEGNETEIDYRRMMKIVLAANYHGHVGIEYEGTRLDEYSGIRATKKLLETVRAELSKA